MLRYADKCHDPDLSEHLCHRRRNPARTLAHTALSFSKKARQDGPRVLRYAQPFLVFSRHPLELLSKPLSLGWPVRRTGCSFLPNQRFVSRLYGLDVGVEETDPAAPFTLKVYPNPTNGSVLVELPPLLGRGAGGEGALILRDISGREVKRIWVSTNQGELLWDVRDALPGSYTVEVLNGGELLVTEKLIVQP